VSGVSLLPPAPAPPPPPLPLGFTDVCGVSRCWCHNCCRLGCAPLLEGVALWIKPQVVVVRPTVCRTSRLPNDAGHPIRSLLPWGSHLRGHVLQCCILFLCVFMLPFAGVVFAGSSRQVLEQEGQSLGGSQGSGAVSTQCQGCVVGVLSLCAVSCVYVRVFCMRLVCASRSELLGGRGCPRKGHVFDSIVLPPPPPPCARAQVPEPEFGKPVAAKSTAGKLLFPFGDVPPEPAEAPFTSTAALAFSKASTGGAVSSARACVCMCVGVCGLLGVSVGDRGAGRSAR
jgi:hypothetical protein